MSASLATALGSGAEALSLLRGGERWRRLPPNLRGAALITLAAVGFTSAWVLAKLLIAQGVHPMQIALFRSVFALPALLPFLCHGGRGLFRTRHPRLHLARALCGGLGMILSFYALAYMPLAELTALGFTSPLFTVLFAALFLGERVGWRRCLAVAVGFLGVVIIVQPGSGTLHLVALLPVGAAMLMATSITIVKRFPASESQSVLLLYVVAATIAVSLVPAILNWHPITPPQWLLLAAVGLVSIGAHSLFIYGFRVGENSFVAPFDYTRLLFAAAAGVLLFGEVPGYNTLLGALVVIAATLYIVEREARRARAARRGGA